MKTTGKIYVGDGREMDRVGLNVNNITDATGVRELGRDGQYRLTAVSINGVLAESYGFDPLGRRAWTSDGSVTNWHVYDGMHVVADLDDAGAVLRSYTWGAGIDNLLAITVHGATETNTFYAITDHLGTVHALADETGAIVVSYRFDAWVNVLGVFDSNGQPISDSAIGNRYLFQGREYSWATGLYNFRARWYDPITGRWPSNDPIGINGGLNQYMAFGNNPVNNIDTLGLCTEGNDSPWWPWMFLGGVKRNLTVNTPNGPLTIRSSAQAIEAALRNAKSPAMRKALNGLLKVVKRGATGGSTATRMGGGLLWWLPGLMSDAKVIGETIGRGESLEEGYRREFEDKGPYIITPMGVIPNIWWHEKVNDIGGDPFML